MFCEILKVSTKMTPKIRMRRPPSKTGSSILPVSCRYPHIITYTEASVITAGSKSVDTVPTWVAMKLFTCPVSHVKKLVHIRGRLASLGFSLSSRPNRSVPSLFCDPTSDRRFASVAFCNQACAAARHRPRTTPPSPPCRSVCSRYQDTGCAGSSCLPQPATASSPTTAMSVRLDTRRYQAIGVKVDCAPCCLTAASRASCAFCNCCACTLW